MTYIVKIFDGQIPAFNSQLIYGIIVENLKKKFVGNISEIWN